MSEMDLYENAQLIAAGIRVFAHKNDKSPSIEDLSEFLNLSLEQVHLIINKMEELNAIEIIKGPFGVTTCLKDHLQIENIPKKEQQSKLADEIAAFKQNQNKVISKVEQIKKEQEEKRKQLFENLENKLKDKIK